MTRKENLIAMRDSVVAGDWPGDYEDTRKCGFNPHSFGLNKAGRVWDAYNSDMNAALAFVAEVLPDGSTWEYDSAHGYCVVGYGPWPKAYEANDDIPSRALLIAALNALIAMEADT